MFLCKQVPSERLSGLNRFSLMGKPLLGLILITRNRARTALATIRMGFRQESGNLMNLS